MKMTENVMGGGGTALRDIWKEWEENGEKQQQIKRVRDY